MLRLTTLALLLTSFPLAAQQNVVLEIDHYLGAIPFAGNVTASNSLGEGFRSSRLEYYLSGFSLIHDGGQETNVDATWVLVNANVPTSVQLGIFGITDLEAIRFSVGVEPGVNHLDPASYDPGHPLAPVSPSMHWGWAAGYRFVAMEGSSGTNLQQNYEIHGLGDDNYFSQTIPTTGNMVDNDLVIKLNGNYEEALRGASVASGPLVHGETGIAFTVLRNFRDYVFTSSEGNGPIGIDELSTNLLQVYPNPTSDRVRITTTSIIGNGEVRVHDALGKLKFTAPFSNTSAIDVELPTAGVYQVGLVQNGVAIAVRRVVKQ